MTATATQARGFVRDLDEEVYHRDPSSLSVSGAKLLLKSPALFRYRQDNPEHNDAFDLGTAAHKHVLGVGPTLVEVKADDWKTKAAREQREEARAAGSVALLTKDLARVTQMATELRRHRGAMALLADGEPEVSGYAIDEETGVVRRGRFDWLAPSLLVDYKTAASANPADWAGRYGVIRKFGYDMQAAWYLDLARDLDHPAQAWAWIVQEKEPPFQVVVIQADEADLYDARDRNRQALERFRDCVDSGVWPGYLPDDTCAIPSLDNQTYTEEQFL